MARFDAAPPRAKGLPDRHDGGRRRPPKADAGAREETAGPRDASLAPSEAGAGFAQRFFPVEVRAGLGGYVGSSGERGEVHAPGGIFTDLNGDGYPDLVLVTRGGEPTYLFVNVVDPNDPNGITRRFDVRTLGPELPASTGAVAADIDNDGDVDVYVVNNGENLLYRNLLVETMELRFENITGSTDPTPDQDDDQMGVGIAIHDGRLLSHSLAAAFGDFDRDGFVDLYVGNHLLVPDDPLEEPGFRRGERNTLYRNEGDGTFTDVTMEYGVPGWETPEGLYEDEHQVFSSTNAVVFADLNDDLWPDLFVSNKSDTPADVDMLYLNLGADEEGRFRGFDPVTHDLSPPFGYLAELAMGVAARDHDNDGDIDLYLTDISSNPMWRNTLAATGEMDFEFIEGFDCSWSWGTRWEDFTNDGWLDLYTSTSVDFRDCLFTNTAFGVHDGAKALGVDQKRSSRGVMSADYDLDGWLDLLVVNLDGPPSLFENFPGTEERHWMTVTLVGRPRAEVPSSTRDAMGARVVVTADLEGDGVLTRLRRDVTSGDSNCASTSSLAMSFGLGVATSVDVEVAWPSGQASSLTNVESDQLLVIEEPDEGD